MEAFGGLPRRLGGAFAGGDLVGMAVQVRAGCRVATDKGRSKATDNEKEITVHRMGVLIYKCEVNVHG
jgi:hypothetical protein